MVFHISSLFFFVLFHILIWYEWISIAEYNCGMVEKCILYHKGRDLNK